jgi:apolipoprotein N-acyltransferase
MGYSLITLLPLAQFASIAGVAGLTFLSALLPMCIATLLLRPGAWRETALAGVLPISLILVFGFYRLSQPYETSVRIGLGAIDELTMRALRSPADAALVAERYASLARSRGVADLDFILFPERVFAYTQGETGTTSELLQGLARRSGATVVAGFDEKLVGEQHANTARIFVPQGEPLRYVKRRLVPGLELNLTPGSESTVMGSTGIAICKDMDFAPMILEYGRQEVSLMLVPAWDFKIDARLHSRMAMLRSIENGFAMARAAATGRLTVNDAYGRILAEQETTPTEPAWLVARVGLSSNIHTVYAKIGDTFAWITVMGSIFLLVVPRRLRQLAGRMLPHP